MTPTRHSTDAAHGSPKRRGQRLLRYALLLGIGVMAIDALVGEKGLLERLEARGQFRALQASLNQVRAENARLREQARRLKEDPTAIEERARRDHGLIKPGEKLFIIKDVPPGSTSPQP